MVTLRKPAWRGALGCATVSPFSRFDDLIGRAPVAKLEAGLRMPILDDAMAVNGVVIDQ
jgi:hypothetical protein